MFQTLTKAGTASLPVLLRGLTPGFVLSVQAFPRIGPPGQGKWEAFFLTCSQLVVATNSTKCAPMSGHLKARIAWCYGLSQNN